MNRFHSNTSIAIDFLTFKYLEAADGSSSIVFRTYDATTSAKNSTFWEKVGKQTKTIDPLADILQ